VFSQPSVKDLLSRYVLVELYTDTVPPKYLPTTSPKENRDFQNTKFNTTQLPLYVILRPSAGGGFETVTSYEEGKINDLEGFSDFLKKPLNGSASSAIARASAP
jgi:hypothetical protein